MSDYIDEMNRLVLEATHYTFEEKNYERAEELYKEALKFNDAYPAYCYGKFLYALGRREEASVFISLALSENFEPAALFKAAIYMKENGFPIKDSRILAQLKAAAKSGHLVAEQYLIQDRIRNVDKLIDIPRLVLEHWKISKKIRKIKKNPQISQDSVWF